MHQHMKQHSSLPELYRPEHQIKNTTNLDINATSLLVIYYITIIFQKKAIIQRVGYPLTIHG